MEIILSAIILVYIIVTIIVFKSALKKYPKKILTDFPSISVIVAARNEEDNILECLVSLNDMDYPEDKIEIIMIDDNSTDNTYKIVDDFIQDKPKIKLIKSKKEIGHLKGKTNALANALEIAKGEIILTTDADCIVHKNWAKTIVSYYNNENVAAVFGITEIIGERPFFAMQSVDSIYLLTVSSGTMHLKMPMSCIGNNMSYRRKVYDEVGGYEKIDFSITEDYKLLNEIVKLKKYDVIYPIDTDSMITTKPCLDYTTLYRQRKRWSVGGLGTIWQGKVLMVIAYLSNLSVLLSLFLFSITTPILIISKFLIDYCSLKFVYKKIKTKLKFYDFLVFEIYYLTYSFLVPIILMISRKVIWKDKKYN